MIASVTDETQKTLGWVGTDCKACCSDNSDLPKNCSRWWAFYSRTCVSSDLAVISDSLRLIREAAERQTWALYWMLYLWDIWRWSGSFFRWPSEYLQCFSTVQSTQDLVLNLLWGSVIMQLLLLFIKPHLFLTVLQSSKHCGILLAI